MNEWMNERMGTMIRHYPTRFGILPSAGVMINVLRCSGRRWEASLYRCYDEPLYVKDRQCVYNVTFRSVRENYCCHVFWVCVFVALGIQDAKVHEPYYNAISGLSGCAVFFLLCLEQHQFRQKLLNVKLCFDSIQTFEIFPFIRRIQLSINVRRYLCKVPIILVRF
jgi:hypothetical protein